MKTSPRAASGVALAGGACVVLLSAAPALAACDTYSGGCEEPKVLDSSTGTGGDGAGRAGSTPARTPSSLPFTGGELAVLVAAGGGAVAVGGAAVVAGRRRGVTS